MFITVYRKPISDGVSSGACYTVLHVSCNTVLPASRHRWMCPIFTLASREW